MGKLVSAFAVLQLALVAAFFSATSSAAGMTYYVAENGNDANAGSLESPWRSLRHAADEVKAGDTVFVRGGTYGEGVEPAAAGTSRRPIKFSAYRDERVVLDGKQAELGHGFNIGSNTTVEGFEIKNFRDYGVVAALTADRLTLRNLTLEGNGGAGIRLWSSLGTRIEDVVMRGNYAGFDCTPPPEDPGCRRLRIDRVQAIENGAGNDTAVDAFAVEKGSDIVVTDSSARGGPGDGFDFKSDTTTLRRVISLNMTRDGIKLWGQDSRLENSISSGHGMDGVSIPPGGPITVINSLIANTRSYGYTAVFGGYNESGALNVKVRNTIFANAVPENGGTLVYFSPGVKLVEDHNLFYDPYREDCVIDAPFLSGETCFSMADIESGIWQRRTGQGAGSIYANPLFVSALSDFHLEGSSPAIDAGTSAGAPNNDLECRARPVGGKVDIGPYEKGAKPGMCVRRNLCSESGSKALLSPAKKKGRRAKISRLKARVKRVNVRDRPGGQKRRLRLVVRFSLSGTNRVRIVTCRRVGEGASQRRVQVSRKVVNGKKGLNRHILKAPKKRGQYTVRASVVGGKGLMETGFRR